MKAGKKGQKEKSGAKSDQEEASKNTWEVKPKKSKSAYIFFLIEKRPEISQKYKGKEIMKKIGSMWKACSDAEKMPYIALAEKDKERYESQMEEFKKSKEFFSEIVNVVKDNKSMKRRSASPNESIGAKRKAKDNKKCRCFNKNCELEAQYVCLCLCSETYSCESHFQEHLKLPNRNHTFDSIPEEPYEWAKDSVLRFLEKEKSKKEKLGKIAIDIYQKCQNINNFEECLREIKYDLKEIKCLIEKFSWKKEQSPLLYQLISQQNTNNEKILLNDSELYNSVRQFCKLCELRKKRYELLNRVKNAPEIEQDFRKTCLLHESQNSKLLNSQGYEEYIKAYQKVTSLYLVDDLHDKTCLFIYDTESGNEIFWCFKDQEQLTILGEFIFQLPNGELFFINRCRYYSYAFIMSRNYQIRKLTLEIPRKCSTAIYYNKIIYCFGKKSSCPSIRFDLNRNLCSRLPWTYELKADWCQSIIFKGNILISGWDNCSLSLFSIEIDSFSIIPYKFKANEWKILINAEERLYLIESNGWIYESEIGDEYTWKQIGKSIINYDINKVYCSYNKGGIYISIHGYYFRQYFKFDLSKKIFIELAFYSKYLGLKKSGDSLEAINWCPGDNQNFKLNPKLAAAYIDKGFSLYHIGKQLERIEIYKHESPEAYWHRGNALRSLERYLEANECYSEAIELNPEYADAYLKNGITLHYLGENSKAIECYDKVIKLKPTEADAYFNKGIALFYLGHYLDAMYYVTEAIKTSPYRNTIYVCYRAKLFNDLAQEEKALQTFNEAYHVFYSNIYPHLNNTLKDDYLKLLELICSLQSSIVEFKEKLKKCKDASLKNFKKISLIKEKEEVVKGQHSELLTRALESYVYLINDPEAKQDFRANYRLYEGQLFTSYQSTSRDDQKYINNHQATSLYIAIKGKLAIYDIEKKSEEIKRLKPDHHRDHRKYITQDSAILLNFCKFITQLPNGELFCLGNTSKHGLTFIIDSNFKVRELPFGKCCYTTGIYFNNNVYCFGVQDKTRSFSSSRRLDLNENRWVNLAPIPVSDHFCHSVIFNGNILISGYYNGDLLLYNIDTDSFSTIPYKFSNKEKSFSTFHYLFPKEERWKILVNADRLYLIVCGGWIYKSDDEYHWQKLLQSGISLLNPNQAYCLYNKGRIYIAIYRNEIAYYKFGLNQEVVTEIRKGSFLEA